MAYIYLIYGISMLIMGAALTVQSLLPGGPLPRRLTAVFAAFAVTHGMFELVRMVQLMEEQGFQDGTPPGLDYLVIFLLPVSFLCLLVFGVELMVTQSNSTKRIRLMYFLLPVLGGLYFAVMARDGSGHYTFLLENASRHFLAFPACIFAALGIRSMAQRQKAKYRSRLAAFFNISALLLLIYGVGAGLLTGDLTRVNIQLEHFIFTSPAVAVLRTMTMVSLMAVLTYAFFIEMSRLSFLNQRMRREFTSSIAHDMRNLAGNIENSSELLLDEIGDSRAGPDQSRLLEILGTNARKLNRLVSDMFEASLLDVHRIELKKELRDLRELIKEATELTTSTFKDRKLTLRLPEVPVHAEVDPARFEQILLNLLNNAGKYSFPGSEVILDLHVELSKAKISVASTGRPIASADVPYLFTRFFRASEAKDSAVGSGLGLAIVKGLVEAHGGEVSVDAKDSGLTTFYFTLPIKT